MRIHRHLVAGLVAAVLLAAPTAAWANVGTPLVWLQMSHLAVGNLLIGLGEGVVLWVAFRARLPLACGIMVAANYASAMAGVLLLVSMSVLFGAGGRPLYGILGQRTCKVRAYQVFAHGALVVEGSGGPLRLALETPFYQWRVGKPIVLPSDQVVYECGPQIVLLDIPTRRIAFLARGRSPVVALDP